VFDATGHHTGIETPLEHVRKGGQVVMVGVPNSAGKVTFTNIVRGRVEITTSYESMWTNLEQALRVMERGNIAVDKIVDTSFPVDYPERAFEAFLSSRRLNPSFSSRTDCEARLTMSVHRRFITLE